MLSQMFPSQEGLAYPLSTHHARSQEDPPPCARALSRDNGEDGRPLCLSQTVTLPFQKITEEMEVSG